MKGSHWCDVLVLIENFLETGDVTLFHPFLPPLSSFIPSAHMFKPIRIHGKKHVYLFILEKYTAGGAERTEKHFFFFKKDGKWFEN